MYERAADLNLVGTIAPPAKPSTITFDMLTIFAFRMTAGRAEDRRSGDVQMETIAILDR
ncbi:MAG: hypothetical protein P8Q92_04600 [Pseudoprimorskyibacter sp.]|nr:hypothetical protein [Pseudoprimorskyibacter sp.]